MPSHRNSSTICQRTFLRLMHHVVGFARKYQRKLKLQPNSIQYALHGGNCQGVNVLSLHAIAFVKSAYWIKFGCSFNFLWYFLANPTTWCISLRKVLWHIVELLRCDGIQLHLWGIGTMIGLRRSLHQALSVHKNTNSWHI